MSGQQVAPIRIEWSDALSVGHRAMDDQHRQLVDLFNEVAVRIHQSSSRRIDSVFDRLIEHTMLHFHREEAAMAANDYPGLSAHCDEHTQLAVEIHDLRSAYLAGEHTHAGQLLGCLQDWLLRHILESDKGITSPEAPLPPEA